MRLIPITLGVAMAGLPLVADPLPLWSDTETKEEIFEFVEAVIDPASDNYVTRDDRIAVFDNDDTLWAEQPYFLQLICALDRLKEKADGNSGILTSDILKTAAEDDIAKIAAGGHDALFEVVVIRQSGASGAVVHFMRRSSEEAYHHDGHVGVLNSGLGEGPDRGWVSVDMEEAWEKVWSE